MSGIAGLINLDGAPADRQLLRRMADFLAVRGPDGQRISCDGPVGLAHALLATTGEEPSQPAAMDDCVWITADARIDGRRDLVTALESRGRRDARTAGDAELILHAYLSWGEDCVEHLLGDFAFAIWDARSRRLFCARDRFGVKPFYYARVPDGFVFSNSLDCVRLHPGVGDALDEVAVGDFLLFGWGQDPAATTFADVRRIPPAHRLTVGRDVPHPTPYWTLPVVGRVRYRRSRDYVDRFRELLDQAVADRLRQSRVGVWMSGGLDSTAIAAAARQRLAASGAPFEVRAHTVVFDRLFRDDERRFAGIAAEAIGIEIGFLAADDDLPLDRWDAPDLSMPEPSHDPFLRLRLRLLAGAAAHGRILLSGEGADEALKTSCVVDLARRMPPLALATGIARSMLVHRRRPAVGLRQALRNRSGRQHRLPPYPPWLNRDFEARAALRARWARAQDAGSSPTDALRSEARERLNPAIWAWYCETSDPGVTGIPVEPRYPFLDVRLVTYLLAIPPLPWSIDKLLLREAMRGVLPERIRLRRKTPLAGDPLCAKLQESGVAPWEGSTMPPELERFVNGASIPPLADAGDPWLHVRPLCLGVWLKRQRPAGGRGKGTLR